MKSKIVKRSIVLAGRKTSVSLEDAFWKALHEIAKERGETLSHLVASIDADRQSNNLSSEIRLFIFRLYCEELKKLKVETSGRGLTEALPPVQ